ncbi:hypothetical protein HYS28_01645 [Candidatus Uhrbacteria bacterium]|nr:hypothetical protein [Candidatus Uhrbacteria bacterium]
MQKIISRAAAFVALTALLVPSSTVRATTDVSGNVPHVVSIIWNQHEARRVNDLSLASIRPVQAARNVRILEELLPRLGD